MNSNSFRSSMAYTAYGMLAIVALAALLFGASVHAKDPEVAKTPGIITIVKKTVGDNGSFTFTIKNEGKTETRKVATKGGVATSTPYRVFLPPAGGTFTVKEATSSDWTLSSVVCVKGNEQVGQAVDFGKRFTLKNGQNVVCTFTNTLIPKGKLTVEKVVINDDGRTKVYGDFSILIKQGSTTVMGPLPFGQSLTSTTTGRLQVKLPVGTYTVEEVRDELYTPTYAEQEVLPSFHSAPCVLNVIQGTNAVCVIRNNDNPVATSTER